MKIIKHKEPKLKQCKINCDKPLSRNLDNNPILKHMNKSFFGSFIGKPGSGKSSLLISFLQTKHDGFKQVFHNIFVFMPASSMMSIDNNLYSKLPEDQLFENVNINDLENVYERLKENRENDKISLIILDDVQSYLKDKAVEKMLLHILANRRNLLTSVFLTAQNYNKIPKNIRMLITDMFLFNLSKDELVKIHDELLNINKKDFEKVITLYKKEKESNKYSFIYVHEFDTIYVNYNELIFEDNI